MKKTSVVLIAMLVTLGITCAKAADIPVTWKWSHSIPTDIAKYTVYELSASGGVKTGTTYVLPYTYEGISQKDFTLTGIVSNIPVGQPVQKCYVVTASDLNSNESLDSLEACGTAFIPDPPPTSCDGFTVDFGK